ncbi:hypothetical protein DFH06DRAFT_1466337 [Mycena polygramma]|nr:hypothetical protein DFH06DRAFT_1466337 [Mycena polygramma]
MQRPLHTMARRRICMAHRRVSCAAHSEPFSSSAPGRKGPSILIRRHLPLQHTRHRTRALHSRKGRPRSPALHVSGRCLGDICVSQPRSRNTSHRRSYTRRIRPPTAYRTVKEHAYCAFTAVRARMAPGRTSASISPDPDIHRASACVVRLPTRKHSDLQCTDSPRPRRPAAVIFLAPTICVPFAPGTPSRPSLLLRLPTDFQAPFAVLLLPRTHPRTCILLTRLTSDLSVRLVLRADGGVMTERRQTRVRPIRAR